MDWLKEFIVMNNLSKEEFEKKLVERFPNLYRDMYGDRGTTCLSFGLECGNGWHQLIWNLSEKIEEVLLTLPESERINFKVAQVKEKFGGGRFYIDGINEKISSLIREFEVNTFKTCEECGETGIKRVKGMWIYVSCENHIR